jgi:hypothetical protein
MPVYEYVVVRRSVSPAVRTNGTLNGAAVNLSTYGAESGIAFINTGTVTDGSHAVSVEESDTGAGGWSAIPAGRLSATPPTITSANSDTQFETGFSAGKAFVRVVIVTTGATTGGLLSAGVVIGDVGYDPVSHA